MVTTTMGSGVLQVKVYGAEDVYRALASDPDCSFLREMPMDDCEVDVLSPPVRREGPAAQWEQLVRLHLAGLYTARVLDYDLRPCVEQLAADAGEGAVPRLPGLVWEGWLRQDRKELRALWREVTGGDMVVLDHVYVPCGAAAPEGHVPVGGVSYRPWQKVGVCEGRAGAGTSFAGPVA